MQLEAAALPVINGSERVTKKDTASLRNEDGPSNQKCQSDRIPSGDANAVAGVANSLGINSSVQAFDDIRKMRKSWGSALRVKVSDDSPVVENVSSKHDVSDVPPVSGDCSGVKPNGMVVDLLSIVDMKRAGSEKKLPGIDLPEVVRALERRAQNPRAALNSVKEPEVASPKIVAVAGTAKKYRRSVSFDHTPGRGMDTKASTSNRSNLAQQKQGARASSVSRLNGPAGKTDKVGHLSKGGKENTSLHSLAKATKPNPGTVWIPRNLF